MRKPEILLLGQITVDDTVPVTAGPWIRQLGGNALYSLAGAKLWCETEQLGLVARVPAELPFDVFGLLESHGLSTVGLRRVAADPLIEWILYEEDGNRQSLPRNAALRDAACDLQTLYLRYLTHIADISASADDIPKKWLPAKGIHLAPQVVERHHASCRYLALQTQFLCVDPSPHYSRGASAAQLRNLLPNVHALLPSQAEVQHMRHEGREQWEHTVLDLRKSGFDEVLLKQGARGALLASGGDGRVERVAAAASQPCDLTGAGDAFSGAYAANRALGQTVAEAASRAVVTAAMVIECSGAEAALRLQPDDAKRRLQMYKIASGSA